MKAVNLKSLLFIGIIVMLNSCSNQPLIYIYADGNNNTFKLTSEKKLFYEPITPELSSSGVYSGGNAKEVVLNDKDFEKLSNEFISIYSNKKIHINKRTMGCGMIKLIYSKEKTEIANISGESNEKELFEKLLNKMLSN